MSDELDSVASAEQQRLQQRVQEFNQEMERITDKQQLASQINAQCFDMVHAQHTHT